MASSKIFDALTYFKELGESNKLCREGAFKTGFCTGPEGLEDAMGSFRSTSNFFLVDDTNSGNTFSNNVGWFDRRVYTVFIMSRYKFNDMADREKKLMLCRRIFRQVLSKVLKDKREYKYGDAMEYLNTDNVYSMEYGRYSFSGVTGLYFMIENDEPTDLTYDDGDWEE